MTQLRIVIVLDASPRGRSSEERRLVDVGRTRSVLGGLDVLGIEGINEGKFTHVTLILVHIHIRLLNKRIYSGALNLLAGNDGRDGCVVVLDGLCNVLEVAGRKVRVLGDSRTASRAIYRNRVDRRGSKEGFRAAVLCKLLSFFGMVRDACLGVADPD